MGRLNDALTVAMAVVFVVALAGVVYVAVTPDGGGESYTSFSLLDANESSAASPMNLRVNETGTVRVEVENHENHETAYRVAAELNNRSVTSYRTTLGNGESDDRTVSFTPSDSGRMTLRLRLYRVDQTSTEPYHTLRLSVSVTE